MSKTSECTKTPNQKMIGCIARTTCGYWKIIGCIIGFIATVSIVIYALLLGIPIVWAAAVSVPILAYVIAGPIVIPAVVATIVCYNKRKDAEIAEIDADFICPQE